jgi:hypothetical protein
MTVITGCPARGWLPQRWDCYGLRATGVGAMASTSGTRGIGDRTLVSTAASTTASATSEPDLRAATGVVETFTTIGQ